MAMGIIGTTEYTGGALKLKQMTAAIAQPASINDNPASVVDPSNKLLARSWIILLKVRFVLITSFYDEKLADCQHEQ